MASWTLFLTNHLSLIPIVSFEPLPADGKFVIAVDNEDRENEGDLIIAAEKVTTEQMAFLIRHSRYVGSPC